MIQWRPDGNPDPIVHKREFDYKVVLEHSATCWSYVDHLVAVDDALMKHVTQAVRPGQPVNVRIPVKAGQVIGQIGAATMDFALVDTNVTRKGFIKPELFLGRDPWKLHTVDPFDYIDEPLRSQLLAINPRKAEPRGGRIDYDVAGRLIGNWYREGTGGYAGLNRRLDYWIGHLSFVPHFVDPSQVMVSLGDFEGQARQFQVSGNRPNPAEVTAADGPVKFELVMPSIDNRTGQPYPDFHPRPMGVLLAQLLDDGNLRVEVFPGKTPKDVSAFTTAAANYER